MFIILIILTVIMKLYCSKPAESIKHSLPSTPRDKKKRGISLSNQKMRTKQQNRENMQYFATQKKLDEEKKVRVQQFIIYDVDRIQWKNTRRQNSRTNVRTYSQHAIAPSTLNVQTQFQIISKLMHSVEFPPTQQFVLQSLPTLQVNEQPKPKNRGRAREIKSKLTEIQQRLNSLLQATKIY